MTSQQHWALRLVALIVIALCCVRCAPQETLTINVPARPPASNYSHRLTAAEEEAMQHPAPIGAEPALCEHALDEPLRYMRGAP